MSASENRLSYSEEQLCDIARDTLAKVTELGASAAAVSFSEAANHSVGVRDAAVENITNTQTQSAAITVFVGSKMGGASSNSFAPADLAIMAERALAIAKQMHADECNGLPEPAWLATTTAPSLEQYHPWQPSTAEVIQLAKEMSEACLAVDQRISSSKSDGAGISITEGRSVLANTLDFCHSTSKTSYGYSCSALAELDEGMETEGWYDSKRCVTDIQDHREIGKLAGERAIARAGTRSLTSAKVPVLFETEQAHRLVNALCGGVSGKPVYRKLTYLADRLGKQVCAAQFSLREDPFIPRGLRSGYHDGEGVATSKKEIITDGVLQTFLLDCYSARKLQQQSTGNAGRGNLIASYPETSFAELLQQMGTGLFVTSTMGAGPNFVTGDYSTGASGFWVEGGAIAYPVKDATLAGELNQLYTGIVAGGDDRRTLSGVDCGSLLVAELTVSGND